LVLLLAGCSSSDRQVTPSSSAPPSSSARPTTPPPASGAVNNRLPARIVRTWSKALNAGDNERAARLFARGARIVQGAFVILLRGHRDAVRWNASLPCSGRIVRLTVAGSVATAEFVLGDRPTSPCDGPGQHAVAEFRIHNGKIVVWRQLPAPQPSGPAI